ncbi:hypothetical protein CSUI_009732, partial [Cystoisospora suis]
MRGRISSMMRKKEEKRKGKKPCRPLKDELPTVSLVSLLLSLLGTTKKKTS